METIQMPPELKQPGLSDGSELIPAEVGAQAQRAGHDPTNPPAPPVQSPDQAAPRPAGYTVDQEGLINNYAVTPEPYVQQEARFGWTRYAEMWNGRLAMMGFALLVLTELVAGKSVVALWSGLA